MQIDSTFSRLFQINNQFWSTFTQKENPDKDDGANDIFPIFFKAQKLEFYQRNQMS